MVQKFRAWDDDLTRLEQSELEAFNAYYSRNVTIGSPPLTLDEAELVLRLMSVEQRYSFRIALQKATRAAR